jgi:sugar-phosphatase
MTRLDCDALLFDLDGVLIDSSVCITRHWRRWAEQHGLDLATIMDMAHGMRTIETMRLVAPHLDLEAEAARFTAAEVVETDGVVAIEGASELLSGLPAEAWAVVTSAALELAQSRMRRAALPLPRLFVTSDDVNQGKPAPEPYLLAAERMGVVPARCVAFEDSPAGIAAAQAAGMRVIALTTTHSRDDLPDGLLVVDHHSAIRFEDRGGAGYLLTIQTV